MRLKNFLFGLLACFLLGACSDDDNAPADADDNFITSVSLTVNNETYDAVIEGKTITVTVPYTVSLNGATANFAYTPSAKIIPDPATITDWDMERTFRVTSFNGKSNDYTYVVVKDEIRHEGDVELKTPADIISFVATGATIIKGNLIIGSDDENIEEIKDISVLEILKEVEGNIIIRKSYTGGTLTGLDNVTSIGGLQIGTEEAPAANNQMEMVSMENLASVAGDISIYGSGAKIIEFKNLEAIEGNLVFSNVSQLSQISLPKLKEAGSVDFKVLPRDFSTLNIPQLTTVEGDLNIQGIIGDVHEGGLTLLTGNTGLTSISGLEKLSKVGGTLSFQYFENLTSFPDFSNLKQLGGLYLTYNHKVSSIDISNADIIGKDGATGLIKIDNNRILTELKTKEDLTGVDVWLLSQGYYIKTNFTDVNNVDCSFGDENIENTSLKKVNGNLAIEARTSSMKYPNLSEVNGFLYIDAADCSNFDMQNLKQTGGQLYISLKSMAVVNMSNLKFVCISENPQYRNNGTDIYGILYGSLHLKISSDVSLPSLERIGGVGLTLSGSQGFSAPVLKIVNGQIHVNASKRLTSNLFSIPALEKLSGVKFRKNTKFDDFSVFGKFIDNGQITADNWSVTGCGYNPTYEDMKAGRYKPVE